MSSAPIIPFLSTISKQRGYSSVIVGLVFTLLTIPALLVRPVIGAITDKYNCRKIALLLIILTNSVVLCVLILLPGTYVKTEIDDVDVLKSPLFWIFFSTLAVLYSGIMARSGMENTICIAFKSTTSILSRRMNVLILQCCVCVCFFFFVSVYTRTCRNNARISNFGGGFRFVIESSWCIEEVIRRKKTMGNPAKRILSSTSSNSPTYEDKKNKVFEPPNRFEVLQMEEQDNVFVQTESQLASQTTKISPEPSKKTLPNIVLTNVTDFIILKKELTSIVGPMGFTCKANRSNIIRSNTRENWMAI
ncbi:major facilitator superfamily domain-containing protein 6-A-like [Aphis craccivora]|uniref:Major facilitator superfamily domain-containing protein 6-A-like n=1 Tax=Aphis craccivora TaxID=307492 RepID=A0A6G0Y0P8_APHCR|nr:major facilitator superfamily domain-containing protein 6-A-like [Aphis craccivora]